MSLSLAAGGFVVVIIFPYTFIMMVMFIITYAD